MDQSSIFELDVSDTLLSITAATAFGAIETLIAANGADTLRDAGPFGAFFGDQNTLIGNLAGSVRQR